VARRRWIEPSSREGPEHHAVGAARSAGRRPAP
jgi:hypothetical protein